MKWLLRKNNRAITSVMLLALVMIMGLGLTYVFPVNTTIVTLPASARECVIPAESFQLKWRHSVEKTPWSEHYQRASQGFILTDTELVSFGAGTPSTAPVLSQKNGHVRLQVNTFMKEINWMVSRNMQGQIIFDRHQWTVSEQLPDYSLVKITVQHIPIWKVWTLGVCQ
jgi:hypothetical protein